MDKNKNVDDELKKAQEALATSPQNEELLSRLHDAQAHYVSEKLDSHLLVELEKNKDWQGLLAIYEKLLAVFPESTRLQKLLKKVRHKIVEAHDQEKKDYFKAAERTIKEMISKGSLDEAEQACYEILSSNTENKHFIHLLAHVQHLQDKAMDSLLTLYFAEAVPLLKTEYAAHKENFIRV